jgi:hypothetical protein
VELDSSNSASDMSGSGLLSGKTVFLLDHTHWMRDSSGVSIELESGLNSGGGGGGPSSSGGGGRGGVGSSSRGGGSSLNYFPSFIPPVTKSMWTCAVESVLEYGRVIWDLFADERVLRFGLCEGQQGQPVWLNDWETNSNNGVPQQSMTYVSSWFNNKSNI